MMNSLYIDYGSTSIKYKSQYGEGSVSFPPRLTNDDPKVYEVDANEILRITDKIIEDSGNVDAIFISVQMHGYILEDDIGNIVTPYISWRDTRGAEMLNQQTNEIINWSLRGTRPKANLPYYSLLTNKEVIERKLVFYTLGSYIVHHLTGRNTTHITDCAASGLYDAANCCPADDKFKMLTLPEAKNIVEPIGQFKGALVFPPIGDHQASFMGSEASDNSYLLNLGTAGYVSALSDILANEYECRPWFDSRRLCTVSGLFGGRHIREADNADTDMVFAQRLADNYSDALNVLPKKDFLIITGGAATHFPNLIRKVAELIRLPYEIRAEATAIDGLQLLVKGLKI